MVGRARRRGRAASRSARTRLAPGGGAAGAFAGSRPARPPARGSRGRHRRWRPARRPRRGGGRGQLGLQDPGGARGMGDLGRPGARRGVATAAASAISRATSAARSASARAVLGEATRWATAPSARGSVLGSRARRPPRAPARAWGARRHDAGRRAAASARPASSVSAAARPRRERRLDVRLDGCDARRVLQVGVALLQLRAQMSRSVASRPDPPFLGTVPARRPAPANPRLALEHGAAHGVRAGATSRVRRRAWPRGAAAAAGRRCRVDPRRAASRSRSAVRPRGRRHRGPLRQRALERGHVVGQAPARAPAPGPGGPRGRPPSPRRRRACRLLARLHPPVRAQLEHLDSAQRRARSAPAPARRPRRAAPGARPDGAVDAPSRARPRPPARPGGTSAATPGSARRGADRPFQRPGRSGRGDERSLDDVGPAPSLGLHRPARVGQRREAVPRPSWSITRRAGRRRRREVGARDRARGRWRPRMGASRRRRR